VIIRNHEEKKTFVMEGERVARERQRRVEKDRSRHQFPQCFIFLQKFLLKDPAQLLSESVKRTKGL
jgi:hypothetical protein